MNRMKELRQSKGLRQSDVADILGTSQQSYQRYENETGEPNIAALIKLADFYGVTIDYLLGRDAIAPKFEKIEVKQRLAEIEKAEREIMEQYLMLKGEQRELFYQFITDLLEETESKKHRNRVSKTMDEIEVEKEILKKDVV